MPAGKPRARQASHATSGYALSASEKMDRATPRAKSSAIRFHGRISLSGHLEHGLESPSCHVARPFQPVGLRSGPKTEMSLFPPCRRDSPARTLGCDVALVRAPRFHLHGALLRRV